MSKRCLFGLGMLPIFNKSSKTGSKIYKFSLLLAARLPCPSCQSPLHWHYLRRVGLHFAADVVHHLPAALSLQVRVLAQRLEDLLVQPLIVAVFAPHPSIVVVFGRLY